jgi:hypothetical protein
VQKQTQISKFLHIITAGFFYKFRGNFFKFSKNDEFQVKPFCASASFHIQFITGSKTLNIKEKAVVIIMPSNDRINQLKKESASEDEFSVIVEDGLYYLDQAKIFLKRKTSKLLKSIVRIILNF